MFRFLHALVSPFKPPFRGLGAAVVFYIACAHLLFPHNDVLQGNLPDPDDYMYLTQVLDWLNGQSWYDNIQHRLNPPEGVVIPFSRFAQMPLAAGIFLFEKLGLSARGAAIYTALIEPLILLGAYLAVMKNITRRMGAKNWAGASAYIALFSGPLLYEFMPGHVDHHGLVILLVLTGLSFVLRMIDEPHDRKAGLAAGVLFAVTLMIALEILPWVILIAAGLGIWGLRHGNTAARNAAAFAAAFLTGSLVCLLATRPPAQFFDNDLLTYSFSYVLLAAGIALPFFGAALQKGRTARTTTGIALALLCAGAFLWSFPTMATGPYGAIDPRLEAILLNAVEEAKPILQTEYGLERLLILLATSSMALLSALFFCVRSREEAREKWALITLLLATALGLTIFYQYRFIGMEAALAVIPLTALLHMGWTRLANLASARNRILARSCLLLLLGPLPTIFVPALFDHRDFSTGVLLFPVEPGNTRCDMSRLEKILRNPYELGDAPHLILSPMELGPELLFRTSHSVLGAPFHTNVQGNVDAARFLTTSEPSEAQEIAHQRNVDLIVVCHVVPHFYRSQKGAPPTFIETLFRMPSPAWVTRYPSGVLNNFLVFRVEKTETPRAVAAPPPKK